MLKSGFYEERIIQADVGVKLYCLHFNIQVKTNPNTINSKLHAFKYCHDLDSNLKHKLTVATHSNSFYLFVLKMLNKFLTTSKYMYITLKGNMKNLTTVKFSLDHLWISKPQNWIEQFFLMKFMIYLEFFFFYHFPSNFFYYYYYLELV